MECNTNKTNNTTTASAWAGLTRSTPPGLTLGT